MATVTLLLYTGAFPSITNRIRAQISKQSSPLAIVASEIDDNVGHPTRDWSFPGLARTNYLFRLVEIDGSDLVVNELEKFYVVPGSVEGFLSRAFEQVKVDVTPGLVSGETSFVFDGTDGKPDWRGWEINIDEVAGTNFLIKDDEYTWDSETGTFQSTIDGFIFASQQVYNVQFVNKPASAGGVDSTQSQFTATLIFEDTIIEPIAFGTKAIVEPEGEIVNLTLPLLEEVVDCIPFMVEVGLSGKATKIIPQEGEVINWLNGKVIGLSNESFAIYKFIRSEGVEEWRVFQAFGNFDKVGQIVYDDLVTTINKALLDGSIVDSTGYYKRLYDELVSNLPLSQVVNFDDWETGNNKYFYSFANSANPVYVNMFHLPDRRDTFDKANSEGVAGTFTPGTVGKHRHFTTIDASVTSSQFPSERGTVLTALRSIIRQWIKSGGGAEGYILDSQTGEPTIGRTSEAGSDTTQPDNILVNKYVIL